MKKPTKKPVMKITIVAKGKKPAKAKAMKADAKGAPSGSEYPKGSFGKGAMSDKGKK